MYVDIIYMTTISQRIMREGTKWTYTDARLKVTDVLCNL